MIQQLADWITYDLLGLDATSHLGVALDFFIYDTVKILMLLFTISSLMGALVYGAKNWSIALWKRFYFCLAVVNIGISTFLFAKHLWVIMIIYLIIGVCQAPTWINGNQLMLHLVPPSRLTEGMAWMGAMNSIGSSAGSAIAGQFIDRMGSHGGFIVVTALALTSLAIALFGFKQIKDSTEQPSLMKPYYLSRDD